VIYKFTPRLFIYAAVLSLFSGCQESNDAARAEDLRDFQRFCQSFDYFVPKWKLAASILSERIKSHQLDPYLDLKIESTQSTHDVISSVTDMPSRAGKVVIAGLKIYEGRQFRLEMRMPVYNADNSPITISAPPSIPMDCASVMHKTVYDLL
jgi:hypothetical protein